MKNLEIIQKNKSKVDVFVPTFEVFLLQQLMFLNKIVQKNIQRP